MHYAIGSVTSQSKRIPCSDWLLKSTLHAQDYGEKTLNGFWPFTESFVNQVCSLTTARYWPYSH